MNAINKAATMAAGWVLLSASVQAEVPADVVKRVDEIFTAVARTDGPGCSIAVSQDGNIVLERAYGMADLEQGVANRPDTVFNIASVSKQFTATSLLLLQEQGKLSLDDDVRKYVSEVPDFGKTITLRHLANHTSGLRDLPTLLALGGWNWVDEVPTAQALDLISRQKNLNFAPGTKYSYSNTGYYLMAVIVERVSGQKFSTFTTENIFKPLGMRHSRFYDDRRLIMKNRAIGHLKLDGGGFGVWRPTYEIVGDGALLTTVQDFALWEKNYLQPTLGQNPQKLIADLTQPGVLNDGTKIDYALGVGTESYRGLATISHSGGIPGYATHMMVFPEQKLSITTFCNVGGGPARASTKAVADLYLDGQFPNGPEAPRVRSNIDAPLPAANQPSVNELKKLAGTYYSAELDARYQLTVEGDKLTMRLGYQPAMALYAIDARRFHNGEGDEDLDLTFGGRGFWLKAGDVAGIQFVRER